MFTHQSSVLIEMVVSKRTRESTCLVNVGVTKPYLMTPTASRADGSGGAGGSGNAGRVVHSFVPSFARSFLRSLVRSVQFSSFHSFRFARLEGFTKKNTRVVYTRAAVILIQADVGWRTREAEDFKDRRF